MSPTKNEKVVLEHIGNHCRGTKFLDSTYEADQGLNEAIDELAKQIPDFHYGRFDLRCQSMDDLKQLRNFKILELNGAASEPAHIYEPGYSIFKAYKVIFWHHRQLAKISRVNHRNGIPYVSFGKGMSRFRAFFAYQRKAKALLKG